MFVQVYDMCEKFVKRRPICSLRETMTRQFERPKFITSKLDYCINMLISSKWIGTRDGAGLYGWTNNFNWKHMVCWVGSSWFVVHIKMLSRVTMNPAVSLEMKKKKKGKKSSVRTHRLERDVAAASAWSKWKENKENTQLMDRESPARSRWPSLL